ncbi:MAG: ZIP family metal transporter [Candidatus Pacebacteria bacterium]|jgi:zinc and cadmium transporter|nr:ZIP family metal transporter [Candidatus Paceibacterota bacterium]|tara:strand:+ start:25560 stop:26336 length:777 start_codon:yes stop_codon:yes gene_type:complete
MANITIYAFGSVIIVSLISLIGIFTLGLNQKFLKKSIFLLVSLSVGALFGDAIIHLIPQAFSEIGNTATASLFILIGIMLFFVLEKFIRWHHLHEHDCEDDECRMKQNNKTHPMGALILASDAIHNMIDGVIIGVSYLISIELGIATTIAIILHEIPQEIGHVAILLHSGYTKIKALLLNFVSSLFAIAGTALVFVFGSLIESLVPIAISFAAGGFLYIAGSDLVPELHRTSDIKKSLQQFIAIVIGIAIMFALLVFN